jgi:hypothetical protein
LDDNFAYQVNAFFFEKKKQKTFDHFGFGLSGPARPSFAKVFWFFFQKRTASFLRKRLIR